MMTDAQKIKLQRWWMEKIRVISRKEMKAEEKRQERQKKKTAKMIGNLWIEKREDIDDLPVSLHTYTTQDGRSGASLEITANDVEFLSAKGESQGEPAKKDEQTGYEQVETDDLPF